MTKPAKTAPVKPPTTDPTVNLVAQAGARFIADLTAVARKHRLARLAAQKGEPDDDRP